MLNALFRLVLQIKEVTTEAVQVKLLLTTRMTFLDYQKQRIHVLVCPMAPNCQANIVMPFTFVSLDLEKISVALRLLIYHMIYFTMSKRVCAIGLVKYNALSLFLAVRAQHLKFKLRMPQ